jgi:hypothetical protein
MSLQVLDNKVHNVVIYQLHVDRDFEFYVCKDANEQTRLLKEYEEKGTLSLWNLIYKRHDVYNPIYVSFSQNIFYSHRE